MLTGTNTFQGLRWGNDTRYTGYSAVYLNGGRPISTCSTGETVSMGHIYPRAGPQYLHTVALNRTASSAQLLSLSEFGRIHPQGLFFQ